MTRVQCKELLLIRSRPMHGSRRNICSGPRDDQARTYTKTPWIFKGRCCYRRITVVQKDDA